MNKLHILTCLSLATIFACLGEDKEPEAERQGQPLTVVCAEDGECDEGFCDRGFCAAASGRDGDPYGAECIPNPVDPATGLQDTRGDICAGYLCLNGRCRSCADTSECILIPEGVTCDASESRPGKSCGLHSFDAPDAAVTPPN